MAATQEAVPLEQLHKSMKLVSEETTQVSACGVSDHQSAINISYLEDGMAETSKMGPEDSKTSGSPETGWARIPKVPDILQENEDFNKHFQPRRISMGPYHHGTPNLQRTENLKTRLTEMFIQGSTLGREDLHQKILGKISQIRSCYTIREAYDDKELAEMMLVDGCSLLCFIQYASIGMLKNLNIDYLSAAIIMQDLFLLENQLPFRVLELFLESRKKKDENNRKSIEMLISAITQIETPADNKEEKPSHLLDLLRTRLVGKSATTEVANKKEEPSHLLDPPCTRSLGKSATTEVANKKEEPSHLLDPPCTSSLGKSATTEAGIDGHWFMYRNVKELMASGIRFRRSKTNKLRDVSFISYGSIGYLHLPPLTINRSIVPLLLNLMAYEMCPNMTPDSDVTSYVSFLDSLIDYSEDVKELESARVLQNVFASREELAQFLNIICVNLPVQDFGSYCDIMAGIGAHVQRLNSNKMCRWTKELLDNYCTSPWKFIALLAAAVLLFLASVQTFFTAFPRSGK